MTVRANAPTASQAADERHRSETPGEPQRRRRWIGTLIVVLLVVWTVVAAYLALLPEPPDGSFGDSLGHFAVSAVLALGALAASRAWRQPRLLYPLWALVAAMLGFVLEMLQGAVGRTAEFSDFVADMLGVAAAMLLSLGLFWSGFRRASDKPTKPPTPGLVVTASVLLAALAVAVVGPVWASDPVQNRWQCSGSRAPDGALGTIRLDNSAVFVDRDGNELPTEANGTRTGLPASTEFAANVRCSHELTASAWVTSFDVEQAGPTRIVASANGVQFYEQNFHLGQEGSNLSVRIRTKPDEMQWFEVSDVFTQDVPVHVAMRFSDGRLDVFVDGELAETLTTEGSALDDWGDYPLSVGDEVTGDRTFIGSISAVMVTDRVFSDAEMEQLAASS